MSQDPILLETRDAIARITLNRPDVLNSFDDSMFARTLEVLDTVARDPSIRAVYLTGAGRAFCAGQDISRGVPKGAYGDHLRRHWNPIVLAMRALDRPIVCAVNGVAAGAGANLALAADFVVAAEEASFIQAFINIGLVPDTGGTWTLPKLVGPARAAQLLMLGEKLPARQAAEWGLIYQACPLADLEKEAWALATRLAAMPTLAFGLLKHLIDGSGHRTLAAQLEAEADAQTIAGRSADHQEGVQAFGQKRKPAFGGK